MPVEVKNLKKAFNEVNEFFSPAVLASLNGQELRIARLKGEFPWHSHEKEDELFLVLEGSLKIELRDKVLSLEAGELVVIPRGVEHRPVAEEEVRVILFEPAGTRNTGELDSHAYTRKILKDLR